MKYMSALLLLLALTGCANNEPLVLTANFSSINNDLFAKSCSGAGCHSGTAPAGALNLEAANSYENLVGVASTTGLLLVAANDAENSYLIHKLEGRSTIEGARMPIRGDRVSQPNIDVVKQWIDDGADR